MNHTSSQRRSIGLLALVAWVLVACANNQGVGGDEGGQAAVRTSLAATPSPAATVSPTPEPKATATPRPTTTPQPTATPDFIAKPPTRPPSPGRTSGNRTYPPGAFEFIHTQFGVPPPPARVPDAFVESLPAVPEGTCPLTGQLVEDTTVLQRRPLNVRVDNSEPARPQAGLALADVVWEALAEGGITRFTATYLCQEAEAIGPVRSARLIDLQLWPMLDAVLVHVGASQPVMDMILSSPWAEANLDEYLGAPGFYRVSEAPASWLRTYTNTALLWEAVEAMGQQRPSRTLRGWHFNNVPPAGGQPAAELVIPFSQAANSVVRFRYDPERGTHVRYQGSIPHMDRLTGEPLRASTVFVIFAKMTITRIVEDRLGSRSLHFAIYGEGPAVVVRDGMAYEVTWRREGENVMIRPVDGRGEIVPFKPGPIWVEIVPLESPVSWK
ncbi:MAG: DUF3048 domain-containing protein [Ardenticatenia bacterium]|nr:DUF3048 domain-containing protein [Ardenticatenia bacterium]